MHTEITTN